VSQACGSISGLHQILANKSKSLYETQVLEIPIPTFCYMEERKKKRTAQFTKIRLPANILSWNLVSGWWLSIFPWGI
jgi:hypothetical protein